MIFAKLSEIQDKLFVPKGQINDYGGFIYRSCEDILKTVKPLCKEMGCVLYLSNEMEELGQRVYVKAKATLIELETGEKVESVAHARESVTKKGMDDMQITGAASSYARKYALAGLFCIDNERDADTNEYTSRNLNEEAKIRAELLKKINAESDPKEMTKKVCAAYKVKGLADLTIEQVENALKRFK